jgi:LysR family cys regulon transcriptional activator
VGIVASVALDPDRDGDLVAIDADHLFPAHTTWVGFVREELLRQYTYDFIELLAPHLDRRLVDRAATCASQREVDSLLARVAVPML